MSGFGIEIPFSSAGSLWWGDSVNAAFRGPNENCGSAVPKEKSDQLSYTDRMDDCRSNGTRRRELIRGSRRAANPAGVIIDG
jgi:hypothetical protein